jgi:hypothetical protein
LESTGCVYVPIVCDLNSSTITKEKKNDCTTAACNSTTGKCVYKTQPCAAIDPLVIAAAVTTAALVGIIIAIIACIGLSGAGTYAAVQQSSGDKLASTQNNPLFVSKGSDQINPLFKPQE